MSKKYFILYIITLITLLTFGLLMAGVIDNNNRKDLNLTQIEQIKLENGEPVQVSEWYQDELGYHAIYARLVDGDVVLYGVVKENK